MHILEEFGCKIDILVWLKPIVFNFQMKILSFTKLSSSIIVESGEFHLMKEKPTLKLNSPICEYVEAKFFLPWITELHFETCFHERMWPPHDKDFLPPKLEFLGYFY